MTAFASDLDEWLWGGGYYEQGRVYWPDHPLEPTRRGRRCAGCGRSILPDDEDAIFEGLTFHNRCFSAKFLHRGQRP